MGYDDNYTCKYVFASSAADNNLWENAKRVVVQLPFCKERTPNMKIDLWYGKFNAGDDEFLVLRSV
jgi:3-methyladenine DNA glycosylase AlkD